MVAVPRSSSGKISGAAQRCVCLGRAGRPDLHGPTPLDENHRPCGSPCQPSSGWLTPAPLTPAPALVLHYCRCRGALLRVNSLLGNRKWWEAKSPPNVVHISSVQQMVDTMVGALRRFLIGRAWAAALAPRGWHRRTCLPFPRDLTDSAALGLLCTRHCLPPSRAGSTPSDRCAPPRAGHRWRPACDCRFLCSVVCGMQGHLPQGGCSAALVRLRCPAAT